MQKYRDFHIHLNGLFQLYIRKKKVEKRPFFSSFASFQNSFKEIEKLDSAKKKLEQLEKELIYYSKEVREIHIHLNPLGRIKEDLTVPYLTALHDLFDVVSKRTSMVIKTIYSIPRRYLLPNAKFDLTKLEKIVTEYDSRIEAMGLMGNEEMDVCPNAYKKYLDFCSMVGKPLRFHMGETNKCNMKKLKEIRAYIDNDLTTHIGHGTVLYASYTIPKMLERERSYILSLAKEKGIIFEVLPFSNIALLGTKPEDFKKLVESDNKYVLGSDDPSIFKKSIKEVYLYWKNNILI